MAIYFVLAVIIYLYGTVYHANRTDRRRRWFIIISFALLILVAGLRNPGVGIDFAGHYARRYTDIANYSWSQMPAFSAITRYEIGYCYFMKFLTLFSGDVQFFAFVTSLVIYAAFAYFIFKESTDVIMSTEIMICSCLYYMCMNIIRQGLAVAFILVAYVLLDYSERKVRDYVKFAVFVIIASTFHSSAILCLTMILFDRLKFTRKQIVIGCGCIAVVYVFYMNIYNSVLRLFDSANNYERYLTSATEGVGNLNLQTIYNFGLVFFSFILGYYILVWKRKRVKTFLNTSENEYALERRESFWLFMVLIASACRLLIFQMNIINRLSYYFIPFMLVLYPYVINKASLSSNRKILKAFVYGIFVFYFVWMTINKAADFYGTVPYSFFWQ